MVHGRPVTFNRVKYVKRTDLSLPLSLSLSLSLSLAASVCVWHLWNNLPREFPITRFEHRSIKS